MEFNIDISLFVGSTKAYGNITGTIQLPACPSIGDIISLSFPAKEGVKSTTIKEFSGHLAITRVIFSPRNKGTISLCLEDVTVNNEENAKELIAYLSDGFGLFFDEY